MKAQQSRNNHATMKKTKKITNLHDYSKEVDKIIATKKPIVEQFMELMKLMDVTFIDENQTNNGRLHQLTKSDSSIKRPKKQDSSVQDKRTVEKSSAVENNRIKKKLKSSQNDTSDCCRAEVLVASALPDEGTRYWVCSKCGKPCNIMSQSGSQTKRKREATTGSTAAVHLSLNKHDKFVQDKRIKKTRKSYQNDVFGIGGKIDRFFLSGEDITLFSVKQFIRNLFLDILKHNKDPMTGLYDYDGIAQEVIDLVNK